MAYKIDIMQNLIGSLEITSFASSLRQKLSGLTKIGEVKPQLINILRFVSKINCQLAPVNDKARVLLGDRNATPETYRTLVSEYFSNDVDSNSKCMIAAKLDLDTHLLAERIVDK